jgi:hypothetical protein
MWSPSREDARKASIKARNAVESIMLEMITAVTRVSGFDISLALPAETEGEERATNLQ